MKETCPDVVAYPTHMPFRDNAVDVVLFTHILMFMNSKEEWSRTVAELRRISRKYILVEVFKCKGKQKMKPEERPLQFDFEEVRKILGIIVRKCENKKLGCYIVKKS